MSDNEEITWSEYVLERAKKLFNSDDLENEDVLEYVVQQIVKNNKTVHIERDNTICITGNYEWNVIVNDDEQKSWHLCIFVSDNKESCEKWIKDNRLIVTDETN